MAKFNSSAWIGAPQVDSLVRIEPVIIIIGLAVLAWFIYKIFLKYVSNERHRTLGKLFKNLGVHCVIWSLLFGVYQLLNFREELLPSFEVLSPYLGFLVISWGCVISIKILRIAAFEYLFLRSMNLGVPVLLVNIITLLMSLVAGGWVLSTFFDVQLAPVLATSAVFTLVLGLALQETLGNLFAGISLQLDKPFQLGDWVEVKTANEKVAGQVQEVTWRAISVLSITDEIVTIPNRTIAQAQISNFSARSTPFVRSHLFRFNYGISVSQVKEILIEATNSAPGILLHPKPVAIISEINESWVAIKIVYSISEYGSQYSIADRYLTQALEALRTANIPLAGPRLLIAQSPSTDAVAPATSGL